MAYRLWDPCLGNLVNGCVLDIMDSKIFTNPALRGSTDESCSGMARIFTAAPGLVKLMNGEPWSATKLPEVYELTEARLQRIREASQAAKVKVAIV